MTPPRGPDVSIYQGSVDWGAVGASGRQFGFCKATEGTTYVNPTLARNRSAMAGHLVLRGLYHFAHPSIGSANAEADHFLNTVGSLAAGEVAVLDLETNPNGLSASALGQWATDWVTRVERAVGRLPILYSYAPFLAKVDTRALAARVPLWIAAYQARPPTRIKEWARWTFWQYTDHAQVPGIRGACDDSVFYSESLDDLRALGGAPPQPSEEDDMALIVHPSSGPGTGAFFAVQGIYRKAFPSPAVYSEFVAKGLGRLGPDGKPIEISEDLYNWLLPTE